MSLDVFLLYLAAWTLMALAPGPAVFFTMGLAERHGMRGAFAGTVGISLGHVLVFISIAFGLLTVLASLSGAMTFIRIAGALYLMYLGVRMVLTKPRGEVPTDAAPVPPAHTGLMLQGILVQITNPKLLLFMFALLPQFIRPDYPLLSQLAIMLV